MADSYQSFKLAIYCTASCLDLSLEQLEEDMAFFRKHLKVSKVYIENHRGDVNLSRERLEELKAFFLSQEIEVAGGITPILGKEYRPGYERLLDGICYTDEASRAKLREAAETAAAVFDEIILDDFFFTNCACDECQRRKGDRTWEEFRLELMAEVSENVIIKPAKAVNPQVKVIIKFPNWNESYSSAGYNTDKQPALFDGVYTGTETRDPAISQQHIPRYASYSLMRWMENLAPERNGGGWFDAFDCTYTDYYLEQAYLTVFGKARELTLFCYHLLKDHLYVPPLGFQLDKLDQLAGQLGQPLGVSVYEPHHAKGENHLNDHLGMLGIPLELTPYFPENADAPLLITANAARDKNILGKMKAFLRGGGQIIMTSGFLSRMTGKGIEELTSLRPTGRPLPVEQFAMDTGICSFQEFVGSPAPITFPVLSFGTNATWQSIVAWNGPVNYPVLMYDNYGKGKLFTLVVPENPADLMKLPASVVTKIRDTFTGKLLPYRLSGPGQAGFFPYDNESFILETFVPHAATWKVQVPPGKVLRQLTPVKSAPPLKRTAVLEDGTAEYTITLPPSAFAAYTLGEEAN
ncbi:hypothetical protein [Gorillibacterium timonense]|uniref:hypothetical protein n=1 Tax=Gorillibacterium timonense TaxID=1689269 RepID=UPI00071D0F96|nr:hypothetical protein [Gorillibacterium timonense]